MTLNVLIKWGLILAFLFYGDPNLWDTAHEYIMKVLR